jgi:energy-coupling factor transporter ATP-binding protein EcfA2
VTDPATGGRIAKVTLFVVALALPLAAAAFPRPVMRHPVLALAGLAGYELLVFTGAFAAKVWTRLQDRWADRLAEWVDALLRRAFSRYEREYRYFLSRVHHDVDLRGLSTWGMYSLAMEQVFVELAVVPQSAHRIPSGPVEEATDEPVDASRRSLWQMLELHAGRPLAIIGPPGSGKTTLLKHVTLVLCGRQRQWRVDRRWRRKIPILLFLREHVATIVKEPDCTLPDVARRSLTRLLQTATEPPRWLETQLANGRCVIMLDGLDEVTRPEDRARVVEWVERQLASYAGNDTILTSRPFGYRSHPLNSATVVQVQQFTHAQVAAFITGWYRAVETRSAGRDDVGVRAKAEDGADDLLDRLSATPALLALAVNPLLLTMMASVHMYRAALPGSRAELYREICQVFLGKRQDAKHLASELSIEQKTVVLRQLAFAMLRNGIRDVRVDEVGALLAQPLAKVRYSGTPHDFLVGLEQTSGLVVERENGRFAFAHVTFQEYLAALHIDERTGTDLLLDHISDESWREVILLWAAQADATRVVMAALAGDAPAVRELALAADCVEEAREVAPEVRDRLTAVLSWEAHRHDPNRRRLVASVVLSRKLRHLVRLPTGAFLCRYPVTNTEFRFFLEDMGEAAASYLPAHWQDGTQAQLNGDDAMVGIDPNHAVDYIDWLRSLGLGVDVRLPSREELVPAVTRITQQPPATRFWADVPESPARGRRASPDRFDRWVRRPVCFPVDSETPEFAALLTRQIATDRDRVERRRTAAARDAADPPWLGAALDTAGKLLADAPSGAGTAQTRGFATTCEFLMEYWRGDRWGRPSYREFFHVDYFQSPHSVRTGIEAASEAILRLFALSVDGRNVKLSQPTMLDIDAHLRQALLIRMAELSLRRTQLERRDRDSVDLVIRRNAEMLAWLALRDWRRTGQVPVNEGLLLVRA